MVFGVHMGMRDEHNELMFGFDVLRGIWQIQEQ
jgi:hypothetical protein